MEGCIDRDDNHVTLQKEKIRMAQTFTGGFNDKFLPQVVSGPYSKHYTTGMQHKMPQTTKASS